MEDLITVTTLDGDITIRSSDLVKVKKTKRGNEYLVVCYLKKYQHKVLRFESSTLRNITFDRMKFCNGL